MFTVRLDTKGEFEVRWPSTDSEVITLGELYVAYESSQPVEQQLPSPALASVQAALAQAQTAMQAATSGEMARAAASELYHQGMTTARPLLELIINRLKGKYAEHLAQLELWGLNTKQGSRGVSVTKPKNENEWADFLLAYVAREQSLDSDARVINPALEQMSALATTVQANREGRRSNQTQREISIQARVEAVTKLLGLLQAAALVLLTTRFESKVKTDLQAWGYDIALRVTTPNDTTPPDVPPVTPPA